MRRSAARLCAFLAGARQTAVCRTNNNGVSLALEHAASIGRDVRCLSGLTASSSSRCGSSGCDSGVAGRCSAAPPPMTRGLFGFIGAGGGGGGGKKDGGRAAPPSPKQQQQQLPKLARMPSWAQDPELRRLAAAAFGSTGGGAAGAAGAGNSGGGGANGSDAGKPGNPGGGGGGHSGAPKREGERLQRLRFRRREPTFEVIEFLADGTAVESRAPRSATDLALHPRDVALFAPTSRLGAPQRATVDVRESKILFKTEVASAIVCAARATLIKGRRAQDTARLAADILLAAEAPAAGGEGGGTSVPAPDAPPFELRVLEVLLDNTAEYFYRKVQFFHWMMESIADDVRAPAAPLNAIDKAHQIIPISKFLTELKSDVQETCAAIKLLLKDQRNVRELCLTAHAAAAAAAAAAPAWAPVEAASAAAVLSPAAAASHHAHVAAHAHHHHPHTGAGDAPAATAAGDAAAAAAAAALQVGHARLASEMLEAYEREMSSLHGSLLEAEENLDNARELWHMQLDSSRNHIMHYNLWLSMVSVSVMAATLLPCFFGMNLNSGLSEADAANFYAVAATSVGVAALSFPIARAAFLRHWRRVSAREMSEQKLLRVLLVQHLEDLDDILAAVRRLEPPIDRRSFRAAITEALGSARAMSQSNVDFLYHIFDSNRDGFLSEAELMRTIGDDVHALHARSAASHNGDASAWRLEGAAGGSAAAAAAGGRTLRRSPTELRPGGGANGDAEQQQQQRAKRRAGDWEDEGDRLPRWDKD